jgi:hypothetical protein
MTIASDTLRLYDPSTLLDTQALQREKSQDRSEKEQHSTDMELAEKTKEISAREPTDKDKYARMTG